MNPEELIGTVLDGRYTVIEHVASGAMGAVYRGERLKLGRAVAIKFLHAQLADEDKFRTRFENEARAMARLEHPNCCSVLDVGMYAGNPFVVMDFLQGTDLRVVLDQGPIESARAVAILRQVLAGLAHAHEQGIVHRDIKPGNIMLTEKQGIGEQVRILDFGLARIREQTTQLTVGIAIGTPGYMAPEQCTGGTIDPRTDLYACGVVLYEMLTGEKPYDAADPIDILKQQLHAPVPTLPGPLGPVIARAMAKEPAARFQSASEFAAALPDAAPAIVFVTRPSRPLPKLPKPAIYAGAALAGVLLIGLIAHFASSDDPPAAKPPAVIAQTKPTDQPAPPPVSASGVNDLVARGRAALDAGHWADAIAAYREALAKAPFLRTDPQLIASVVTVLGRAKSDPGLVAFLHDDIGDAAKPYLQDAAANGDDAKTRAAAKAALKKFK